MSTTPSLARIVIELRGQTLEPELAGSLTSVQVLQKLSMPTICELEFEPAEATAFAAGDELRVMLGTNDVLFDGEVTALRQIYSGGQRHSVQVRAFDRLHRLRKRQTLRSFADLTAAELARELVADLGLTVEAEEEGPVWPRIVQWRQTDLALLDETARRAGLYFMLEGTTLRLLTAAGGGEPNELVLGTSLIDAEFDSNLEPACRELTVHGWGPWLAEPVQGTSSAPRLGREGPLPFDPAAFDTDAKRMLPDETAHNSAQANAIAQAEIDRRCAGEIVFKGVTQGDVNLRPGGRVQIEGVLDSFAGRYSLTAVTHSIDRRCGYRSAIDTAPLPELPQQRGTITTIGEVLDADDPDGLGRVRVSLPTFGNIESDWLEVLTAGAGAGKGLISLPDQGDQVLLLLPRHDPALGIVLGGLYGRLQPVDSGVVDGSVKRFTFQTPGGQRLCLDDDRNSVTLETGRGNRVELTPSRVRLADTRGSFVEMSDQAVRVSAERTLELIARGQAIRICGASIDFERA